MPAFKTMNGGGTSKISSSQSLYCFPSTTTGGSSNNNIIGLPPKHYGWPANTTTNGNGCSLLEPKTGKRGFIRTLSRRRKPEPTKEAGNGGIVKSHSSYVSFKDNIHESTCSTGRNNELVPSFSTFFGSQRPKKNGDVNFKRCKKNMRVNHNGDANTTTTGDSGSSSWLWQKSLSEGDLTQEGNKNQETGRISVVDPVEVTRRNLLSIVVSCPSEEDSGNELEVLMARRKSVPKFFRSISLRNLLQSECSLVICNSLCAYTDR